jgi:hypothetical protein
METAESAPIESAPSQAAPTNSSQSEQEFLQNTRQANKAEAPKEAPKPVEQSFPKSDGEQLPNEQPDDLPPTVEYKIKDIHGNEKVVTPEWMSKYFQVVGQENLLPLVNDEKNAPLLLHIAERTMKLNQAYQEASRVRPEYESYKGNVETYFQELRQDPSVGFEKMMADMGIDESDQEAIIEKMAMKLIEKREMSPEQRAVQAAIREQERIKQENERYRQEAEEMKIAMETERRAPVYQTGMATALQSSGLDINDSTWSTMVQMCKQYYGSQSEPISQDQFNAVAKHMAEIGMSFKKSVAPAPVAPQTRTVSKGFQGRNAPPPSNNKEAMTEQDWLQKQNLKSIG